MEDGLSRECIASTKEVSGLKTADLKKGGQIWPSFSFSGHFLRLFILGMDQLRKIIQETLSQVLEEDYASVKEIKELANDSLIFAAKVNVDYLVKQMESEGSIHFYPIKLIDVYQENPKKYPMLGDFLTNSVVMIQFIRLENSDRKGDYSWRDEKEYDTTALRTIRLYYDKNLEEGLRRKSEEIKSYKNTDKLDEKDLYFTFWYAFVSTLEHEIQHAYDDYRSNSNLYRAKLYNKYKAKYHLPSGAEIKIDDPEKITQRHQEYLKLQHEIWARFTQTINNPRFRMTKADFGVTKDGVQFVKYEMLPLEEVVKNFKREFSGWNIMTDKVKRILINRVAQYWHKEQESLPEKNKESINREIQAKKKKETIQELREIVSHMKQLNEGKKKKIDNGDDIHLPDLTMKKKDLIQYLKDLYNIDLK